MSADYQLPGAALAMTTAYLAATLRGDRGEALRIALGCLDTGTSAPELELGMIVLAQREVGRLWQENLISVAQEHVATSISQIVLSHLYPHLPREARNGRRALVACVEGELHDLGARMGADFLEMRGFDASFLGANVTLDRLLVEIEATDLDLLGLSVTTLAQLPQLERALTAVRRRHPGLPLLVGGRLLEEEPLLFEELGLPRCGVRADQLAASGAQLVGC